MGSAGSAGCTHARPDMQMGSTPRLPCPWSQQSLVAIGGTEVLARRKRFSLAPGPPERPLLLCLLQSSQEGPGPEFPLKGPEPEEGRALLPAPQPRLNRHVTPHAAPEATEAQRQAGSLGWEEVDAPASGTATANGKRRRRLEATVGVSHSTRATGAAREQMRAARGGGGREITPRGAQACQGD